MLLLSDYAMPQLSGADIVEAARQRRPGLPALLVTGYADADDIGERPSDVAILSNPSTVPDLASGLARTVHGCQVGPTRVSRLELILPETSALSPSARSTLRTRTAGIHEALHVAAPFAAIAGRKATVGSYARLLVALHAFHSSMIAAVDRACRQLDLPELRMACERRRLALASDLGAVGMNTQPADAPVVVPRGTAWAVGCLYTLVGSTLGGKVIYRQLDYLFETSAGREFFAGTPDDGRHWRELCRRLELFAAEQHSLTPMVEGAQFAFEHFASCLERQP